MEVSPANGGKVEIDGTYPDAYPAQLAFASGKSVVVVAVPTPGYEFTGWSGDLTDTVNSTKISMTCNKQITANFSRIMHNLSIKINAGGSTSPTAGNHSYAEGEVITLIATPYRGWRFESWTGDVAHPKSSTTNVTVNTSKSISAHFVMVFPLWLIGLIVIVALVLIGLVRYHIAVRQTKRFGVLSHPP